jgi:two-component system, NtrC family, sensor histidine kinase PilS
MRRATDTDASQPVASSDEKLAPPVGGKFGAATQSGEGERRNTERRSDARNQDRRRRPGRRRDDSLFGAFGADSQIAGESFFDPGWLAAGDTPADTRFMLRQARRVAQAQDSALARVYRTYAAARAAVGVGLVAVQGVSSLMGVRGSEWVAFVSVLFAVQAITLWLLPRFGGLGQPPQADGQAAHQAHHRRRQWLATVGVDLVAFTLLHVLEQGSVFNFAALLVLPVLMAGVLTSRLLALGTAAGVALALLGVAWVNAGGLHGGGADMPTLMLQAGMAGLGLFVITLLAGELAGRLAREEIAARGSLELARQQAQLNRLVIEEMADGVLVVDHRLGVRAANPAARALLVDQGLSPPAPFMLHERAQWNHLVLAVERALADGSWPDAGRDVSIDFAEGLSRTLRLRVRFMRGAALGPSEASQAAAHSASSPPAPEPFAVLLLEDLRTLQARIRQEKLAAMGRVSAGIAHEIRNPLAAISQANALMLEDELSAPQARLAQMVADNVARLKRLVDDVMEVAPGGDGTERVIDVSQTVAQAAADWAHTVQLPMGGDSRLRADLRADLAVGAAGALGAVFDPEHLRRVLVNLLDNAHRHATAAPGAIVLRLLARDEHRVELSVLSDGPRIGADVERFLFEPFFSTRSRGTGLGLYICRELCERYGASIDYVPRPAAQRLCNEFVVSMRRAKLVGGAASLPLDLQAHSGLQTGPQVTSQITS